MANEIPESLLKQLGAKSASMWAPILSDACSRHGILGKRAQAAFIANIMHESGALGSLVESLNYRADKLVPVFGPGRITEAQAQKFGRLEANGKVVRKADEESIANIVYGGAFGKSQLGNTEAGDGWRFRGRGLIQLTGRANYTRFAGVIGVKLDDLPSVLEKPEGAAESAAHFFVVAKCIAPAEQDDIRTVRHIINGGDKGLPEVMALFAMAKGLP